MGLAVSAVAGNPEGAETTPPKFPDGELRAIWWGEVRAKEREEGLREIHESVTALREAGFNALFVWGSSLYLAALREEKYVEAVPQAKWDAFGEVLRAAHEAGMQVHLWYSPWLYKQKYRAVELREHPEWAAVNAAGQASEGAVCAARPEVRQFELQMVLGFVERYPALDGVHLEEPGYPWGEYCFCKFCREAGRRLFGFDFAERPDDPARSHFKVLVCNDFVFRLRQELRRRNPRLLLSYNGSAGANPDWYIGRDWLTLARHGMLDFYVPQVYTTRTEGFQQRAKETLQAAAGRVPVCLGLAITYSGIYPRHNTPEELVRQVKAARELGAAGIVVFHRYHLREEERAALAEVLRD